MVYINSLELTGAITGLANAIACNLTVSELAMVASLFVQLGDTLATVATHRALCEERKNTAQNKKSLP